MIVIFDIQHQGRQRYDRGAEHNGIDEVAVVQRYVSAALLTLTEAGVECVVLGNDGYADRHRVANNIASQRPDQKVLYLACHYNSGVEPGDYAAFFYDVRSAGGKRAAEVMAQTFAERKSTGAARARAIPAGVADWTANARATINGIYAGPNNISGVCVEPWFIQHLGGVNDKRVTRQGHALAFACMTYGSD